MANFLHQIDLRKFFKRALVVTFLLACIEVVIFSILYYKQSNNNIFTTTETSVFKSTDIPIQKQSGDLKNNVPETHTGNSVTDTIYIKNSTENQPTKSTTILQPQILDTTAHTDNKMKLLSSTNIQIILQKIRAQKRNSRHFNNCIQIRKSSNCNISNAFKIANLLQSKGYIITGRFTMPEPYFGVKVTTHSGCLQLTIGRM